MTMKTSLLTASMLAIGLSLAGQAMASQYPTASQRIAEANREATENPVPGVHVQEPPIPDADTLKVMVQASAAKTSSSNDEVDDVTVRDRGVSNNPYRTFQGWWKD